MGSRQGPGALCQEPQFVSAHAVGLPVTSSYGRPSFAVLRVFVAQEKTGSGTSKETASPPVARGARWLQVLRTYFSPLVVASLAWVYVLCHLDPAGSYPSMPEGPGLTVDETFNVQQGVIMVEAVRFYGLSLLTPEALNEVFSPPLHLPDHPPLGRIWLGLHHNLVWWLAPPDDPEGPFVTACARAGSATAFALTILIVGCCARAWYGEWAGLMSSLAFAVMPRLIGHAHLAALESITNLTCTAATLAVVAYWNPVSRPTARTAALTGILFGLALLTKIQAVLIPLPVIVWSLLRWRRQALLPLTIWGGTGLLVFFLGWPWLWLDPVNHFLEYFRGATDRAAISVWYKGEKFTDQTIPWNYPFAYFWWTIPFKLQLIGIVGICAKPLIPIESSEFRLPWIATRWSPREFLLVVAGLWPLVFFTLPGIPVYDCERLWLTSLPVWMILIGRGSEILLVRFQKWWTAGATLLCSIFLTLALIQILVLSRFAPTYLSFYGGTALGMPGVVRFNLERNYWGDAITRSLLEEVTRKVPAGETVAVTPVLHQFQAEEMWRQSPILRRHGVEVIPYEASDPSIRYVLLFYRLADLPEEFHNGHAGWEAIREIEVDNVPQAGLYRRTKSESPVTP